MNNTDILKACDVAGTIGTVSHKDYANYVIGIAAKKKNPDGQWVNIENPYMPVDGRVKMARDDHRNQGKKLDIYPPVVVVNTESMITLSVVVESEVYGKANGMATSRLDTGTANEKAYPFETAETSALGRALAQFGYGVFAGTGLTSAEDMERAAEREQENARANSSRNTTANNAKKTSWVATGNTGVCPTHKVETIEYKNEEQKIQWAHRDAEGKACYEKAEEK